MVKDQYRRWRTYGKKWCSLKRHSAVKNQYRRWWRTYEHRS